MTLYSELFQIALEGDRIASASTHDLISQVVSLRPTTESRWDPAGRISDAITYDLALKDLCDRMNVVHELDGDRAGDEARLQAEKGLIQRMPPLSELLALDEPMGSG
jgi:hypothetical protein